MGEKSTSEILKDFEGFMKEMEVLVEKSEDGGKIGQYFNDEELYNTLKNENRDEDARRVGELMSKSLTKHKEFQEREQEEQKENAKDRRLIDALRELNEVENNITKAQACKFGRVLKNIVNEKKQSFDKYADEQAEIYGINKEKVAEIKKEYNEALSQWAEKYTQTRNSLIESKGRYQEMEKTSGINLRKAQKEKKKYSSEYNKEKKELERNEQKLDKDIIKEKNQAQKDFYEKLKNCKTEEDRKEVWKAFSEKIKNIEEEYENKHKENQDKKTAIDSKMEKKEKNVEEWKKHRKYNKEQVDRFSEKIKRIDKEDKRKNIEMKDAKNKSLQTQVKKQNIFRKIVGSITKRIGGDSKFQREVITPLKEQISNIKDNIIPGIGNGVTNTITQTIPGGARQIAEHFKNKSNEAINQFKKSIEEKIVEKKEKLKELQKQNDDGSRS